MSEELPPRRPSPLYRRKPTAGEAPRRLGASFKQNALIVYGALTAVLAGVALFMAFAQQRPLDSPYVIAPAIGALWFGLRLFMIWGSGNAR